MKEITLLLEIFCILFVHFNVCDGRGNRQISAVEDKVYDAMINILLGTFNNAVSERNAAENSAVQRIYRYRKNGMHLDLKRDKHLFLNGKQLLRKSDLKDVVSKIVRLSKGTRIRKCAMKLALSTVGGGVKSVKSIIDKKDFQVNIY